MPKFLSVQYKAKLIKLLSAMLTAHFKLINNFTHEMIQCFRYELLSY